MVCIAAFIILLIVGIFVAFISIFKPKVGKRYLRTLKKSWGCFGKRITLQKCETSFGDDIKNNVLSKLIIRHPKWVKPVSAMIEAASILIVVITVWSLVEGVKAGLALYSLGTCNVKHAESCARGSEVCSIDNNTEAKNPIEYIALWFSDWGEIFGAIPDKFRDWNTDNFDVVAIEIKNDGKPGAIDFFDPGCIICKQSFQAQLDSGFFENYMGGLVERVDVTIEDGGTGRFGSSTSVFATAQKQIEGGLLFGTYFRMISRFWYGTYPHNFILEMLMTFGIVFTSVFVPLFWKVIKRTTIIIQSGGVQALSAICFIYMFCASMTSGSVFLNTEFWIFLSMVCSYQKKQII